MEDPFAVRELQIRQPARMLPGRTRFDILDTKKNLLAVVTEADHRSPLEAVSGMVPRTRILNVRSADGEPMLSLINRDEDWLTEVKDADGQLIGRIQTGETRRHYTLLDEAGHVAAVAAGDLAVKHFTITGPDGERFAQLRKTWARPGKELLTTSDYYKVTFTGPIPPRVRTLIVMVPIVLDMSQFLPLGGTSWNRSAPKRSPRFGPLGHYDFHKDAGATVPVTIYLSDESIHGQVETAIEELLASAGLRIEDRDEPVIGSWFRRMWASAEKILRSPAGHEAAGVATHTADTRLTLAQDAAVTATLMQNLAPVIVALQPTQDAQLRVGALLIVKVNWVVNVCQLTAAQQAKLDHQPQLALSPREIIAALDLNPQPWNGDAPPALT